MGNVVLNPNVFQSTPATEYTVDPRNGVLRWINAGDADGATDGFPKASESCEPRIRTVDTIIARFGTVRLTYELASHKHYRNTLWSWRLTRADVIDPAPTAPPDAAS